MVNVHKLRRRRAEERTGTTPSKNRNYRGRVQLNKRLYRPAHQLP